MLEMLINPKKAERRPWEMFFVGLFYASLSVLLVSWIFGKDAVLSQYSGILIVTFTVMFSIPFVFYTIRLEEKKISPGTGAFSLIKEHKKALYTFLWLFFGFVIGFSIFYIVLDSPNNFKAQVETYCLINRPDKLADCTEQYGINSSVVSTGFATSFEKFRVIFFNNFLVMFFTLIFSLIFGAGVIFILAWNASVIAAAIVIFTKSSLFQLPIGLARYILHGIPEIAAYFLVAIAGGLVSVAVIRHEFNTEKFWEVLHDSINLIVLAIAVLLIAAILEVFVTPLLF